MMGSVRDEASYFIIPQTKQFPAQFTEHEFDTLMATYNITGPQLAELKAIYGPSPGKKQPINTPQISILAPLKDPLNTTKHL